MLLKSFLKRQSNFKHLTETDLDALARALSIEDRPAGDLLVQEGKIGKDLYVLVEGEVRVTRYNPLTGESEELKMIKPGEMFGLLSLADNLPAVASCVAHGAVKVGILPRTGYHLLSRSAAPIALGFQLAMAEQLASDIRSRNNTLRGLLR
jgi:CRP-like cAMP-binding protein